MSHIVTIAVEVGDLAAIKAACQRLELEEPVFGKTQFFSSNREQFSAREIERPNEVADQRRAKPTASPGSGMEGILVKLPEWVFPVVCDLSSGTIHYDNYQGHWGDQKHLDKFVQIYGVEKATLEARRKGYSVSEQPLNDGSVKLTINMSAA